jgi:hypothetical protein
MSNKFLRFTQHIDFIREKRYFSRHGTWNFPIIGSFFQLTKQKASA